MVRLSRGIAFGVAAIIILLLSAVIAYTHSPPFSYGIGRFAFSTVSISSGLVLFSIIGSTHSGLLQTLPALIFAMFVPIALFVLYFRSGFRWALVLASAIWLIEGYMGTIGAFF
jgi:hypothetical protein